MVEANEKTFVSLNLLNKTSAKKHLIKIPIGSAYVIQDIRIVPISCQVSDDPIYKTKIASAEIHVYIEQDIDEDDEVTAPILLYNGIISNNTRLPSSPLEHPIYDLALVACGEG